MRAALERFAARNLYGGRVVYVTQVRGQASPFLSNDQSERFLDVYRRAGSAPFKEVFHGTEATAA